LGKQAGRGRKKEAGGKERGEGDFGGQNGPMTQDCPIHTKCSLYSANTKDTREEMENNIVMGSDKREMENS